MISVLKPSSRLVALDHSCRTQPCTRYNTRLIFLLDRPLLFLQSYMVLFGLSAPRGNLHSCRYSEPQATFIRWVASSAGKWPRSVVHDYDCPPQGSPLPALGTWPESDL
jgi:hypothetical protein